VLVKKAERDIGALWCTNARLLRVMLTACAPLPIYTYEHSDKPPRPLW
jgi:hypothetical protein